MNILIWLGIAVFFLAMWMWWEVEHAEEAPEDFDEYFDEYDDKWFDEPKEVRGEKREVSEIQ
jgi:hypothetical protein